jgi:hypothetical protein
MGEARQKEARHAKASVDAERFLEFLSGYAEEQFRRTGLVLPMFDGVAADGERIIVPAPWRDEADKVAILRVVRTVFRLKGVVRYGMLSEGWMAAYDPKEMKGSEKPKVMPRDRQDRKEAVVIAVVEPPVTLFGTREIIRPWDGGKPTLGPFNRTPEGCDIFQGRMMELIDG